MKGSDIDWLVPHQANIRIIQATADKLGLPRACVVTMVESQGNTSAASVPLALDAAIRDGRIQPGHKVMLEAVGGGMTWGAALPLFRVEFACCAGFPHNEIPGQDRTLPRRPPPS